jgi:hypothetical protein
MVVSPALQTVKGNSEREGSLLDALGRKKEFFSPKKAAKLLKKNGRAKEKRRKADIYLKINDLGTPMRRPAYSSNSFKYD